MHDFIAFASSKGFQISDPKLNGELIRFANNGEPRSNSWYIGWINQIQNEEHVIAQIGSWRTGESYQYSSNNKISNNDKLKLRNELAKARAAYKKEKENRQREAALKANTMWREAGTLADAAYLKDKCLPHTFGAKFKKNNGALLIPMRDMKGFLHGLQMIFEDGSKRFLKGQRVTDTFFFIGDNVDPSKPVIVCEGYATGATIHMATELPVFCAFSADNLINVCKNLKKKYPQFKIAVCGDDDKKTEGNPGVTAANKAAKAVSGIAIFPKFDNDTGTDFNDLMKTKSINAVKTCILTALKVETRHALPIAPSHEVKDREGKTNYKKEINMSPVFLPLGFDNRVHFFYTHGSKSIIPISNYSETEILKIAPMDYWNSLYLNDNGKLNFSCIKNDLIRMIEKRGVFDKSKIRATGVWQDNKRIVVNTGMQLFFDGKESDYNTVKSVYTYIRSSHTIDWNPQRIPLAKKDSTLLIDICKLFQWEHDRSAFLLAGWIAVSRIAGALNIRPHVWLTGGSGTGKSTVMNDLVEPCLGFKSSRLFFQGGSTEAGIRQTVANNSIPIIFDEFETNDESTRLRYLAIIELFRQSWSATGGKIAKGTSEGKAIDFDLSFAALVSSIRVMIHNDADLSRFSILELKPHNDNEEHWKDLEQKLASIDSEFGERLFMRSVAMIETINISYQILKTVISRTVSQRVGQQVGMLLAGFFSLMSDTPITEPLAVRLVGIMELNTDDLREDRKADEFKCLEHLLSAKCPYIDEHGCHQSHNTIYELLKHPSEYKYKGLRNIGIGIESEFILIANQHMELKKIFQGTQWVDWKRSLKRIQGAEMKKTTTTFGNKISRFYRVPKCIFLQ